MRLKECGRGLVLSFWMFSQICFKCLFLNGCGVIYIYIYIYVRSFVEFTRCPTVPVLHDDEPWDQEQFLFQFDGIWDLAAFDERCLLHHIVRSAAVDAITGLPKNVAIGGGPNNSDEDFLKARRTTCRKGAIVFRGGRCHGPLRKDELAAAVQAFLQQDAKCIGTVAIDTGGYAKTVPAFCSYGSII